jgi:glutaredoxin|tara:strand:+ start:4284 stop:4541 length:258 start_codon:yes stop_codon:yes gene_type:complete
MKFRVYTKNGCPFCQMAISLLAEKQKEFECYSLDSQPELLAEIKSTYRWDTVPLVVEITSGQEKFIGGFTDLREYLSTGKQILKG